MECNKEEAMRAKEIAAKKMEIKDFVGARKIATKAQHLYPDLENISQMICVCEVHCSAENKLFGNELDWYSILQVIPTADNALIKKQYRKLALLLHPDKNKFTGAEAAFKLIGEAQRNLLDKDKRSFFDHRRKAASRPMPPPSRPPQTNRNSTTVKSPRVQNNFSHDAHSVRKGVYSSSQPSNQQAQTSVPNGKETFWTLCPFCAVRYQYYKEVLNRALRCQSCDKPFIAYDMSAQGMPAGPKTNQGAKNSQPDARTQSVPHNLSKNNKFPGSLAPQKPNIGPFGKTENDTKVQGPQKTSASPKCAKKTNKAGVSEGCNSSLKANGKRGKNQVMESSESFQSESSLDSSSRELEIDAHVAPGKAKGESSYRRSARSRKRVSYDENGSDGEEMESPSKRPKVPRSSSLTEEETVDLLAKEKAGEKTEPLVSDEKVDKIKGDVNGDACKEKENPSNASKIDHVSAANPDSSTEAVDAVLQYPDPDFSDFDEVRNAECFKVGQIWAVYDTLDAMPRFYARIRKVFSPGFKLRITWLEADPVGKNEVDWVNKELPVSCGIFRHGDSENTEDRLMFSHPISWAKCVGRGAIKIYPKKEETWALFKDWHVGWTKDPDNSRKYEYDFVEVISDYDETLGVRVAFLGKLKGFASLFCRKGEDEIQITPSDVFRFSHRVLSFRMTGKERDDVPRGSFELDPASITANMEEISLPPEMKMGAEDHLPNGSSAESMEVNPDTKVESEAPDGQNDQSGDKDHNSSVNAEVDDPATSQEFSDEEAFEIPEPEFFKFDDVKALDKFQIGQVWALYSDVDGLPKYYAQIKKVDPHSDFKLQVVWLENCMVPSEVDLWKDKEMPISCGTFKIKSHKGRWYIDPSPFSHQVSVLATTKKNVFEVYPREGEIWALYKHWGPNMTCSQLVDTEYVIVEVQERSGDNACTRVSLLEKVSGFHAVFKVRFRENSSSAVSFEVPDRELLKFSHLIPSHKLTDENGGSLRGYWELDLCALPFSFHCKN